MSWLIAVAVAAFLAATPTAIGALGEAHTLTITAPAKRDFTLATLDLASAPNGPSVAIEPSGEEYVAAAQERDDPRQLLILVVNRQAAASTAPEPVSVRLHIISRTDARVLTLEQHVDVLTYGALGQDCSAVTQYPASGTSYLWGYKLKALTLTPGRFDVAETVAHALDQACSDAIDSQFERWVRQEPSLPHP